MESKLPATGSWNAFPKRVRNFKHFYDTWEYNYFEYLIDMRNIFASRFIETYPDDAQYVYSEEFFYRFAKFVYNNSSKRIDPTIKQMSKSSEEEYSKYLFKKEEFE